MNIPFIYWEILAPKFLSAPTIFFTQINVPKLSTYRVAQEINSVVTSREHLTLDSIQREEEKLVWMNFIVRKKMISHTCMYTHNLSSSEEVSIVFPIADILSLKNIRVKLLLLSFLNQNTAHAVQREAKMHLLTHNLLFTHTKFTIFMHF